MQDGMDTHTVDPTRRDDREADLVREDEPAIIVAGNTSRDDLSFEGEVLGGERRTGRTYEPRKAVEEGLSYTPPRDPPTLPGEDDPQESEIAAGFASSMEDTDPDERVLPERIDKGDLEIQEDVGLALRYNSETAHLTDVVALVGQGTVRLYGTVPDEDDIAQVYAIVSALEGVHRVISHLEVAV